MDIYSPEKSLLAVFRYAYQGLVHSLSCQRNMKIHWLSGFMVMIVGMALEFDLATRSALFFSVFLILFAEVLNSALEAFVDLHIKQYHHQAKLAKDAAAAGVLVLATAVVILFADILFHYRETVRQSGDEILRSVAFGLPSVVLLGVVLFRVLSRALKLLLGLATCALFAPLALSSHDHFFSLAGALFIGLAVHARWLHPEGKR